MHLTSSFSLGMSHNTNRRRSLLIKPQRSDFRLDKATAFDHLEIYLFSWVYTVTLNTKQLISTDINWYQLISTDINWYQLISTDTAAGGVSSGSSPGFLRRGCSLHLFEAQLDQATLVHLAVPGIDVQVMSNHLDDNKIQQAEVRNLDMSKDIFKSASSWEFLKIVSLELMQLTTLLVAEHRSLLHNL